MIVNISRGFTYTPKWNGNRKLPDDEQVKVHMEFVGGADLSAFVASGKKGDEYFIADFCSYVKTVDNLEYIEDDGTKVVAGPEDVATVPAFASLYIEIKNAYAKESAVVKKN